MRHCCIIWSLIAIVCLAAASQTVAQSPHTVEFFENKIRPVLVQHCYECHAAGADEVGGALLLDSKQGMVVGGDSGPVLESGNADASVLVAAMRYESSEMPPSGKLPDEVIQDFEKWIAAGATDPRSSVTAKLPMRAEIDLDQAKEFWAFQPIDAQPPATGSKSATGSQSAAAATTATGRIDQYLIDAMNDSAVVPNSIASDTTRLRRLAFDLTGLPPDQDQLADWIADPSTAHWNRIVDSLLASSEFAEHWARHWMDVARYADSNGSDFNATHHEAWRYRDYLIRSFASDRSIDTMIAQQIAGDLLPAVDDRERHDNIVATTFLMLGTKMLSERDKSKLQMDVVDEQIDTVGRAFLGLTLGCARCHDHKFDPVPTEDYYALAGIFKNTVTLKGESQKYVSTWNRTKLPVSDEQLRSIERYQSELRRLEKNLGEAETALKSLGQSGQESLAGVVIDNVDAKQTGVWKESTYFDDFVGPGYVHDNNKNKGKLSIEFATRLPKSGIYEVRFAYAYGSTRDRAVPVTVTTADGKQRVTVDQRTAPIAPVWRSLGKFRFSDQTDAVVTISNAGTSGYVIADAVQFISQEDADSEVAGETETEKLAKQKRVSQQKVVDKWKQQIKIFKAAAPPKLPEAMAPADVADSELTDSHVHIRGEVRNLGDVVRRGFLQVCSPGDARIANPSGSGRRELADWLTDPDNPLVARVFVNRVWMHLMGQGIVRTVDNFGAQGERPTHPELLDALASDFVREGWHLKALVRDIVTSSAYQRSTDYSAANAELDPENRLLWRAHRRRLPAEAVRDTMLQVAGELDRRGRIEQMAGRGTLVSSNDANSKAEFAGVSEPCRSVYLPTVRSYMPPLLTMLDVADPDLLVGRRPTTNVPAQALVLINSPDVNHWATEASKRVMHSATGFDTRLHNTFLLTLQRDPTAVDRNTASQFFADRENDPAAWREYIAGIFASTEFRLLD
ncbi:DUF1553 domain-containing protein [Planctomycetes bacterium K23_9]|uniref:Xanthan lyase n=1 Tax=Stieleria marina TaxID=1930275 RepID=A0A517NW05_9BACT|nr:Xanthan lyase precursor [Planctomycetes bacterium K23_9]